MIIFKKSLNLNKIEKYWELFDYENIFKIKKVLWLEGVNVIYLYNICVLFFVN